MTTFNRLLGTTVVISSLAAVLSVANAAPPAGSRDKTSLASLKGCIIQIDAPDDQPAHSRRMVDDLRQVIAHYAGAAPEILPSSEAPRSTNTPLITLKLESTGDERSENFEAFTIQTQPRATDTTTKAPHVVVSAERPGGMAFGIADLIRRLIVGPGKVQIEVPLKIESKPRFATRSMYAHLHWAYNNPYSLRTWSLDDWKRYIDLLTHLGFNTMQMWPMMELIPHPMSAEDEAYLKKYAQVVDYLHEQRGMKAFIGSCPNNITENARGVPIEKREYFDFEKRLDPGAPANLKRILDYRSDLYRTVPNADGYWVIDSDPGGWKGSPASAFVDILAGHRDLIDKFCKRPADQPLIYWMWMGWGTGKLDQNLDDTLAGMIARVKEPWMIHVCQPEHMTACEKYKIQYRSIFFPYNMVEDEPSGPLTDLRLDRIRKAVDYAADHGIKAIQGNAQTPLVQLPNITALALAAWGQDPTDQSNGALYQLAGRLLCRDAHVLVQGWESLYHEEPAKSLELANRLRALAKDDSARGTLAVIIGDWQPRILEDLASMLVIHAAAMNFSQQVAAGSEDVALVDNLAAYLQSAAVYLEHTGYHNNRIIMHKPYCDPVRETLAKLKGRLGEDNLKQKLIQPAADAAGKETEPKFVGCVVDTLMGKR